MCASWDNPGIVVISRESRDTLTEGNDPRIVTVMICRSVFSASPEDSRMVTVIIIPDNVIGVEYTHPEMILG